MIYSLLFRTFTRKFNMFCETVIRKAFIFTDGGTSYGNSS